MTDNSSHLAQTMCINTDSFKLSLSPNKFLKFCLIILNDLKDITGAPKNSTCIKGF